MASIENPHEQLVHLRLVSMLPPDVGRQVVAIIEKISDLRRVPQGGVWLRENEPAENKGFVLLHGSVGIRKATSPEVTAQAPELLGETMQFTPNGVRTATVTALEDIIVARFYWDDFWDAIEERLPVEDQTKVRDAVEAVAWEHLAG